MFTDTRDLVSITDVTRSLSKYVQEVAAGRTLVVLRNNEPAMAMVPLAVMEKLSDLEERESDVRLLALAIARSLTDDGQRYELDEVLAELGIDVEDEDDNGAGRTDG